MHPNTYLRTYWRGEFKPQVFVATGPDDASSRRFTEVIQPAIEQDINWNGTRLTAHRVDLAQFGEPVLTEIADAVTHSVLTVADISTLPSGERIGNVMFAVGLALACRQSAEVLLVREDRDRFLFEASTVPTLRLEFQKASLARSRLAERLRGCLRETELVNDARVHAAIAGMTGEERQLVALWGKGSGGDKVYWLAEENPYSAAALSRLLDKELIRTAGVTHDGQAMFLWTRLGRACAEGIDRLLPVAVLPPPPEPDPASLSRADDGGPKWI